MLTIMSRHDTGPRGYRKAVCAFCWQSAASTPHDRTMGHYSASHVIVLLISILMWVGAAAAIVVAGRKMGLFGRRPK
ncbi:hypothetical protein [Polymorphobacter fuscus]|uniref:Uncharacterized protein n=1 Tax=Sandarakinorhabdus fusca TaxID=1439888 RepID=A0A7C9KHM7_9SPHN|nr:hypothetical protein [Polymorphobacter fuscus]KAB7649001.1 hypothetical protein F9290_04920 [Polymorphobacter fuscus]MQT16601.1 hypothetical protein [Polymorphobacter fuscus]NJC07109.1 hypothetical protein [Polymorphobacter fuscus]